MQRPKSLWRWSVNPWPVGTMWIFTSLVPRPSHHPVFWSLAVCKNGGGRPGPFYHMNDISVYLSRQRGEGVPHLKNELEAWSSCFCLKYWRCEAKTILVLVQNEERVRKMHSFHLGLLPPPLCLPTITLLRQSSHTSGEWLALFPQICLSKLPPSHNITLANVNTYLRQTLFFVCMFLVAHVWIFTVLRCTKGHFTCLRVTVQGYTLDSNSLRWSSLASSPGPTQILSCSRGDLGGAWGQG